MFHHVAVLCYHRVLPDDCKDLWASLYRLRGTAVDESVFRQHMIECRERFEILDEGRALRVLTGEENLGRPGLWITFDDAYADVMDVVDPVLQELQIPATLFVATAVLTGRWLPADRWYAAVASAKRRQGSLFIGSDPWNFDLDNRETLERLVDGPEKRAYLRAEPARQEKMLFELSAALESAPPTRRLYLDSVDLARCIGGKWSLGSHTVSHSLLPGLSDREVTQELTASWSTLESITGKSPATFSYPDGRWDERVAGLVREAGYTAAITLVAEIATSENDRFRLPRILARNEHDLITRLNQRIKRCSQTIGFSN